MHCLRAFLLCQVLLYTSSCSARLESSVTSKSTAHWPEKIYTAAPVPLRHEGHFCFKYWA